MTANNTKLTPSPDVAGLVYRLERPCLESTHLNVLCQEAAGALLSLSAQLQEQEAELAKLARDYEVTREAHDDAYRRLGVLEAECEGNKRDAELLGHLMNLVPVSPKEITWVQGRLIVCACQEIADDRAFRIALEAKP